MSSTSRRTSLGQRVEGAGRDEPFDVAAVEAEQLFANFSGVLARQRRRLAARRTHEWRDNSRPLKDQPPATRLLHLDRVTARDEEGVLGLPPRKGRFTGSHAGLLQQVLELVGA